MPQPAVAIAAPDDGLPLFLDVEQAAKVIGISRSSAYDAIRRGEMPVVKFGRRLRVPRGALLALAQGAQVTEERGPDD
jgi:excisionase family DNA binding protein